MLITTVIVAYIAYTRVVCASMHVLFPVRKFLMCAIAFAPGKLRVVLKIADQSRAGSHFNSQNTHSQFRNSHFTRAQSNMCYYANNSVRLAHPTDKKFLFRLHKKTKHIRHDS